MVEPSKRLPAVFYRRDNGKEPVRDWLKSLDVGDRKNIGNDIMDIEYNWPVGMPLCRFLSQGLWEIRSSISDGRIARVIFCIHEGKMIILHGFIKKTRKTPLDDLGLALKRKKEVAS